MPKKTTVKLTAASKLTPAPGALRVWWIPQVPGKPFYVPVASLVEVKFILTTLAKYDLFQYENRIKGDYCNAGGLEVFEDDQWIERSNEDGDQIDDVIIKGS